MIKIIIIIVMVAMAIFAKIFFHKIQPITDYVIVNVVWLCLLSPLIIVEIYHRLCSYVK
jgi:uncharacterized membrane protein (DUF373 family)